MFYSDGLAAIDTHIYDGLVYYSYSTKLWKIKHNDLIVKELNLVFHLFIVNLIDFVYLIQIMFSNNMDYLMVLTSNIERTVATATTHRYRYKRRVKQLFGNILFILVIHALIHIWKVSIR